MKQNGDVPNEKENPNMYSTEYLDLKCLSNLAF
jgi:hypothetical protein